MMRNPYILFVRAIGGRVDYISLSYLGVNHTPVLKSKGRYVLPESNGMPPCVIKISISKTDEVTATLRDAMSDVRLENGSKVNDLYRFIFRRADDDIILIGDEGFQLMAERFGRKSNNDLSISVSDGIRTGESIGG